MSGLLFGVSSADAATCYVPAGAEFDLASDGYNPPIMFSFYSPWRVSSCAMSSARRCNASHTDSDSSDLSEVPTVYREHRKDEFDHEPTVVTWRNVGLHRSRLCYRKPLIS